MKDHLLGLSDYTYDRTRTRLRGLTDDEYLWEPVPGCWTLRTQPDGRLDADWAVPLTGTGPFTTIAWRLWHLIDSYGSERNAAWLNVTSGGPAAAIPAAQVTSDAAFASSTAPPTAAAALEAIDAAHTHWRQCLLDVTDESLAEKLGPIGGQYADSDRAGFALHMLDEFIHHGAEIALLRDLYRATRETEAQSPLVRALLAGDTDAVAAADTEALERARVSHPQLLLEAVSSGRWHAVELLLQSGFPADVHDGASALHHAAGAGRLDTVQLLVEHGAATTRTDPTWGLTPEGWADYFHHTHVTDYLKSLPTSTGRTR